MMNVSGAVLVSAVRSTASHRLLLQHNLQPDNDSSAQLSRTTTAQHSSAGRRQLSTAQPDYDSSAQLSRTTTAQHS